MNGFAKSKRRKFLKLAVGTAGAAIAAGIVQCNSTLLKKDVKGVAEKSALPQAEIENALLRMQQNLKHLEGSYLRMVSNMAFGDKSDGGK